LFTGRHPIFWRDERDSFSPLRAAAAERRDGSVVDASANRAAQPQQDVAAGY